MATGIAFFAGKKIQSGSREQIATEGVGNKRGIVNGYRWTRRFVAEMEKLAAPLLKQSDNGADSLS